MKIKIDLHVHTSRSVCALLPAAKISALARKRGLSGVAITDHNTIEGALEVRRSAHGLRVIVGEEIKTTQGEIIGYFLSRRIAPGRSPEETIEAIRDQGGLVAVPHPFDRMRSSRLQTQALERILPRIDIIESGNSRDILRRPDQRITERAEALGAVSIVSSDAHLGVELGRSYMLMDDFTTPEEFLSSLRRARMVGRRSPLWVHLVTKIIRPYKRKKTAAQ